MGEYKNKHKLDLMFVYGVDPKVVEQAPGGRENAKMVSKGLFEALSLPEADGNYFLRPDCIKAAILLDGTKTVPTASSEAAGEKGPKAAGCFGGRGGARDGKDKDEEAEKGKEEAEYMPAVRLALKAYDEGFLRGHDASCPCCKATTSVAPQLF